MPSAPLSTNGLIMPSDFPNRDYEAVFQKAQPHALIDPVIFEQFGGAWNAIAYRFLAACDDSDALTISLGEKFPNVAERYAQERHLFGFFSNGFSVFEASFYALFSLGALIDPKNFPINSDEDKRRINPSSTIEAMKRAFPGDQIIERAKAVTQSPIYLEWREVRNILTHRSAPGRTFFVGFSDDDEGLPDSWKIKGIPLDSEMPTFKRASLAECLSDSIKAIRDFTAVRF